MIDVDQFEEQLDLALTDELRSAIGLATATPPAPAAVAHDIPSLLRAGRIQDADQLIVDQRAAATGPSGSASDRRDAALWSTMQALRDGRAEDARAGTLTVRALSQEAGDRRADDRFWGQRFWVVLEWGDDTERYELLDQCRERAYGHDDVSWRSALTLLCARLSRTDEAAREFDATASRLGNGRQPGAPADDFGIVTNLAEAAALMGDADRASLVQPRLAAASSPIVFDGHMCVTRGAVARHQGLIAASRQQWPESDRAFQLAVDAHRTMGALPLVARTLYEWSLALTCRGDSRAWDYLTGSTELARGLHMTGPIAGMP